MRHDLGVCGRFDRARLFAARQGTTRQAATRQTVPRRAGAPGALARQLAVLALCAFGLAAPAHAQGAPTVKIQGPAVARLFGANCWTADCWLSGIFAPVVVRENVAVVTIANGGQQPVTLTPRFTPTNGPAVALGDKGPFGALQEVEVPPGQIAALQLRLPHGGLQAGLYTGELSLTDGDNKVLSVPVEVRIRSSAFWALVTAFCGIVLGRLAQLTYDPKTMARLQLFDRLDDIEQSIGGVADGGVRAQLQGELDTLRRRLTARSADAATLLPEVEALEARIEAARRAPAPAGAQFQATGMQTEAAGPPPATHRLGILRRFLMWLAGISPVPLQVIYDWLLPIFVLLTLIALTIVFVLQQYGGSGSADTFGAGGLSDYAGLFLAGIASEAIVGGLRSVKLK